MGNLKSSKYEEALYLIQFQLWKEAIYTLMAYGDEDRPMVVNKDIVFFTEPTLAFDVLASASDDFKHLGPPPTEVAMVCDIPEMIRLLEKENIDEQSIILNCFNTIFDMLKALQINIPDDKKEVLYNLADHLTFSRDFADFLREKHSDRRKIKDSILWCIRMIFARSKIYAAHGWLAGSSVLLDSDM